MIEDKLEIIKQWITNSNNIVFFGGAGVSTESGIPDFRSTDGIYHMNYDYPPEMILSRSFFNTRTNEFYEFYRDKMICQEAKPNITHRKLRELEKIGKLHGIVTQNIDGLHQKAESENVLELHGSIHRNYCMKCNTFFDLDYIIQSSDTPRCSCGGIVKPDVVLYEEPLNTDITKEAVRLISNAEVLIIGGTSLSVYPAAALVDYYRGNKLILINKTITPYDKRANLLINSQLGEVFSQI
jgi:NAD-dependent deacetylase